MVINELGNEGYSFFMQFFMHGQRRAVTHFQASVLARPRRERHCSCPSCHGRRHVSFDPRARKILPTFPFRLTRSVRRTHEIEYIGMEPIHERVPANRNHLSSRGEHLIGMSMLPIITRNNWRGWLINKRGTRGTEANKQAATINKLVPILAYPAYPYGLQLRVELINL